MSVHRDHYPDHDILDLLTILILKVEALEMSAVTDLVTAVTNLTTAVAAAVTAIQSAGGDNPAVAQAVVDINNAIQALNDAVAAIPAP